MVVRKILIIEDEKDVLDLLTSIFNVIGGYLILSSTDGEEALSLARENIPDIMLLDTQLPKLNGYEVCKAIKSDPTMSYIKILMLSGMTQDCDVYQVFEAGADAYVTKPFSVTTLMDKVAELLGENPSTNGSKELGRSS